MKLVFLIVSLAFSTFTLASDLTLTYDSFYRHLKKVNKEDMDQLTMAFGFTKQNTSAVCAMSEVQIHTPKLDIPVAIDDQNRFELPIERALKQAKAEVDIKFVEDDIRECFVSIQLRVRSQLYRSQLQAEDLTVYLEQFDEFFSNAGSFFSFLLPKPTGLVIQFDDNESLLKAIEGTDLAGITKEESRLFLSRDWLAQNNEVISLSMPPRAIFARMPEKS